VRSEETKDCEIFRHCRRDLKVSSRQCFTVLSFKFCLYKRNWKDHVW